MTVEEILHPVQSAIAGMCPVNLQDKKQLKYAVEAGAKYP